MPRIIYIHGFLSSSNSLKAKQCKAWLETYRPDIEFSCPDLSSYAEKARYALKEHLLEVPANENFLVGSSMGGFWGAYCVEQGWATRAILINPAVSPHTRFTDLVGRKIAHYYSDEVVCLSQADIDVLAACEPEKLMEPERYWLMVQTADDVLDYRLATARYAGSKQLIEEGGSHSFEGFESWMPEIVEFLGL